MNVHVFGKKSRTITTDVTQGITRGHLHDGHGLDVLKSQNKFIAVDPSVVDASNVRRAAVVDDEAGKANKPYSSSKKGRAPRTHEWGENVDCTLRIVYGDTANRANVEAAERMISSVESNQDLMSKMNLRPSDIRKIRPPFEKRGSSHTI